MKIGIIGLGSFGKTLLSLVPLDIEVVGYDSKPQNIPSNVTEGNIADVCMCNLVILSVPIAAYAQTLPELSRYLPEATTLIDVCSVKTVAEQFKKQYLPNHHSYLSLHPLFGPRTVNSKSAKKVVVTACGDDASRKLLHKYADLLNISLIETTAEKHDRTMASTQALTFFLGNVMKDFLPDEPMFAPPSFRLLTELRDFVNSTSPALISTIESNPYFNDTITVFMNSVSKQRDKLQ